MTILLAAGVILFVFIIGETVYTPRRERLEVIKAQQALKNLLLSEISEEIKNDRIE